MFIATVTKMELTRFLESVNRLSDPHIKGHENSVIIPIKKLFATVGGSPFVKLKCIYTGFDWDSGKIFLEPEEPLMLVSDYKEAPETIRKLQEKIGWLEYEKQGLQSQIKRMKKIIKEFENANQTD